MAAIVACGAPSAPNSAELGQIAGAIRELQARGATFSLDQQVIQTGGPVPKGKQGQAEVKASGTVRGDRAGFRLRVANGNGFDFDVVIDDSDAYARPHGANRAYFFAAAAGAETFYEGVRLNLLRDVVLLAAKESFSAYNVKDGQLLRRYSVTPAPDQLGQLLSEVDFETAAQQQAFARSASGSIDVYLTFSGDHLDRYEIHLVGTDPLNGLHSDIKSTVVFSNVGKARPIAVPDNWIEVSPDQLFSTAPIPGGG
jgi:hypothetical protein